MVEAVHEPLHRATKSADRHGPSRRAACVKVKDEVGRLEIVDRLQGLAHPPISARRDIVHAGGQSCLEIEALSVRSFDQELGHLAIW
ncbi:hypothetical protein ATY30_02470 [Sinorhizobium americanum]|nr:hypothetical protein CO664_27340 [Sinorhizobium sp. NG07B]POH33445.1 hypothetical protein ATY30_02470 [Sinorhizobium americanum]